MLDRWSTTIDACWSRTGTSVVSVYSRASGTHPYARAGEIFSKRGAVLAGLLELVDSVVVVGSFQYAVKQQEEEEENNNNNINNGGTDDERRRLFGRRQLSLANKDEQSICTLNILQARRTYHIPTFDVCHQWVALAQSFFAQMQPRVGLWGFISYYALAINLFERANRQHAACLPACVSFPLCNSSSKGSWRLVVGRPLNNVSNNSETCK
ncbi:hypothetical protein T01_3050 [Trichinella spiralis]|uniref:Uncharacterized protein n=1 Tax=Trichinella spiralis TaxID=6334 RepID=A0A0V1BAX8_TRISP|nr:hypothetical protein T01_3050 [Trichinella spiralis]